MHCRACDAQNPADAAFCMNCGAALAQFCPQCNTQLPVEASFCFKCGARLGETTSPVGPAPATEREQRLQRLVPREFAERLLSTRGQVGRERRTVTILFSDVKGSTAMAEDLDPEDVMEIMDGAFDVLIEPVYRYEGTLARLMGDAVLAFFGAPIAHEDDPERACRAALDIIEGARAYSGRLERERGISGFDVRVGIHTGLVVVGEVGSDLRVEYTAMGDAINLAARMENAAEPGTVLVSKTTYKLVAPLFETEPLGPVQVKGKADPVPVYRLLAARAAPGKVRGIAGLESPLVGRQAEFGAVLQAVDRLQHGVGGIVTVIGEAGIGKSRLVAELRGTTHLDSALHLEHLTWVEGRCLSYGSSIAYLLWLDILRGMLGVSLEDPPLVVRDALREVARVLCADRSGEVFDPVQDAVYPYLSRLLSLPLEEEVESALADLEGGESKARTFQAVETILESVASEGPLVLLCEDLHWADSTSLELLEYLLPLIERLPLLFLCVFRPERDRRVWRLRETIASEHQRLHTEVNLQALSLDEGETLVDNLLQAGGLPENLRQRIVARAEGNPFYLEEILRSLLEEGAIRQDIETGRWRATRKVPDITIPETLQGVLVARIDRLQEETRRVLQMAAVIGRLFLYRVLEAIAREERDLDARVRTLQQEEMIRERARLPELEYIFKHDLTREAAYNGLLKVERRLFHRQVAEALERLFPDRVEEQVGLLTYHWERSGDPEKAAEYLLRAGDQARLAYAHDEAIDYYQRALAFLREGDDVERAARTVMKLGLTYHNAFRFREARAAYDEGFGLWQEAARVEPAGVSPAPHALRVHVYDYPKRLDPARVVWASSGTVVHQLFSGLVELTPGLDVVPAVARSWEVLEGGRRYVFHLREDAIWSDGVPLTARDFEYAWKRVLDPAIGSQHAEMLYVLEGAKAFHQGATAVSDGVGVNAPDDATLVVDLEEPAGYFLQLLGDSICVPMPRHVLQAHGEAWTEPDVIVSNGPFRVESWQPGESMVLTRNPAYLGRFRGNVERLELVSSGQDSQDRWSVPLALYEAGELDTLDIEFYPTDEMNRVRQRHADEYLSIPFLYTWSLLFDINRTPFNDQRVRRAFAMAADKERFLTEVVPDWAFPATGGQVPPGIPGHSPGIGLPYDPERARQLLADAGFPGGRGFPPVDLTIPAGPLSRVPCEYVQAEWQNNLGVTVNWRALDQMQMEALRSEPSHLEWMGWVASIPDPDEMLSAVPGLAGWRNAEFRRLIAQARRATDQTERLKLYARADKILVEEAAIIPFMYGRRHLLFKPWLRRLSPSVASRSWWWKEVIIDSH